MAGTTIKKNSFFEKSRKKWPTLKIGNVESGSGSHSQINSVV